MPKPVSVQIGPIEYEIVWDQDDLNKHSIESRLQLVGLTEPYDAQIHVSPEMDAGMQHITLLHEILHAVWFDANLSQVKDPTQENIVSMLAPRLLEFLRSNKLLVKYIS